TFASCFAAAGRAGASDFGFDGVLAAASRAGEALAAGCDLPGAFFAGAALGVFAGTALAGVETAFFAAGFAGAAAFFTGAFFAGALAAPAFFAGAFTAVLVVLLAAFAAFLTVFFTATCGGPSGIGATTGHGTCLPERRESMGRAL